jgi:hypothetical protein
MRFYREVGPTSSLFGLSWRDLTTIKKPSMFISRRMMMISEPLHCWLGGKKQKKLRVKILKKAFVFMPIYTAIWIFSEII